ncbi:flavin reductase [Nocardia sp. NPDC005745]|uniref:flavin reductase n=1 Tax=Nocardia sp. NPDC005745 TaxID=3157061 RepID=UPI0033FD5446
MPTIEQLDGVWKLGAKYSKFSVADPTEKLAACGLSLDGNSSRYGPVLPTGIGWLDCRIVARFDLGGDHGITVGEVERVWFNTDHLTDDGKPKTTIQPLMQQTGNMFTTTGDGLQAVPYF